MYVCVERVRCPGGGISIGNGGFARISNSSIEANTARQFGGGLLFGTFSPATCGFTLDRGTVVRDNVALGAAQVYTICSADVLFEDVTVQLSATTSQVCAQRDTRYL